MKNSFTLTEKILLALYQGTDEKALTYRPFTYLSRLFPRANPGSLRVLASKLIKNGHLDKIEREGRVLLGITDIGKKELVGKPKTVRLWDKKTHLIILSVPETERQLRQKIRSLLVSHNYRLLHQGIWFSPVKNEELINQLKQEKLLNYVIILEAADLVIPTEGMTTVKQLVISAWELDKLQKSYEKYLGEAGQMQKMTHFDTARYSNLLDLQEFLLLTIRRDPFFSDEFIPLSPLRKKDGNIFQNLIHKKML